MKTIIDEVQYKYNTNTIQYNSCIQKFEIGIKYQNNPGYLGLRSNI